MLGDDVEIVISAFDETNTRIPVKQIIADIKAANAGGFVGFAGVQSNQFPRTMDIARQLRAADIQVCIGGFHISGCAAMLPELPADIQETKDIGISLFIGEAEGRLDDVFTDAYKGKMQAWRDVGVITCAGYILGFPNDSKQRILHDIQTIQKELPVDLLEFFFLTPLPGSQDHKEMAEKGAWMDADMNKYDLNHVTARHNTMSKAEWEDAYLAAWDAYYSTEHITTIMKRAYAGGTGISKIAFMSWWFYYCLKYEGVHPLEGGYYRKKIPHRPPPRHAHRKSIHLLSQTGG